MSISGDELRQYHVFLAGQRFGSPTGKAESGTEVEWAMKSHRETARRKRVSMAQVLREALERYLEVEEDGPGASWENDPILQSIGRWPIPPREESDLNEEIDRIVYE